MFEPFPKLVDDELFEECPCCDGAGFIEELDEEDGRVREEVCPDCDGSGEAA